MTLSAPAREHGQWWGRLQQSCSRAFTLIELMVVIVIFAVVVTLVGTRSGTISFFGEEAALRRLSETLSFLHFQAIADQSYYQMELDLNTQSYRVQVLRNDADIEAAPEDALPSINPAPAATADSPDLGALSLELSYFLNPAIGSAGTFIPPPLYPSLAEPQKLPDGLILDDVVTIRGKIVAAGEGGSSAKNGGRSDTPDGVALIRFSPRGVSEFAALHLSQKSGRQFTLLVNPFTGVPQLFREYREFDWATENERTTGAAAGGI